MIITPAIHSRVDGGAANRTMPNTTSAAAIPVKRMGGLLSVTVVAVFGAKV